MNQYGANSGGSGHRGVADGGEGRAAMAAELNTGMGLSH